MKTKDNPSAEEVWEGMNEQERIECLAVKVMGWFSKGKNGWMQAFFVKSESVLEIPFLWNPLTDWNHWRQVEEKVMEDGRNVLLERYISNLINAGSGKHFSVGAFILEADLPTRAKALYLALQ